MRLISVRRQIVEAVVETLLAHGYHLEVWSDGEKLGKYRYRSGEEDVLIHALFSVDEEFLYVYKSENTDDLFGWVLLNYLNDDIEVIHDHTVNLTQTLAEIDRAIDAYLCGDA